MYAWHRVRRSNFVSLALCFLQIHTSAVLRTAPAAINLPRAVFVKVGDGPYVDFDPPAGTDVMAMRKGAFVKAVRHDDNFAGDMKGITSQCTVSFVISTAAVQPTAEELARSTVLEGMHTLGETAGTADGHVYVHIKVSSSQADLTGECYHNM